MKTSQLTLVKLATFVLSCALYVFGKPLVELVVGVEQAGHYEMKQCPQFYRRFSVVLQTNKKGGRGCSFVNLPCIEF